jgi:PAS domain S-box-containing protein
MVFQLWTDESGINRKFLYVSQINEKMTGVPADAVLADPLAAYDLIVPEHRAALFEAESRIHTEQKPFDVEVQFRRADGELRWCRIISASRQQDDGSWIWDGIQVDTTEQKLAHQAEVRALRYQVNPHFLFNSLSAISTLILDGDPAKGEQMVMSLADFYRKSLQLDPLDLLPLTEEIRLQRLYLDVEKVRFPDELDVRFDIEPSVERALVPGMVLQPLVENAIKYGMGTVGSRMTLTIMARQKGERLLIEIGNDRVAPARRAGTGFGLSMTRRRLEMAFGTDFEFRAGPSRGEGFSVEMSLPIRFQQVQIAPAIS